MEAAMQRLSVLFGLLLFPLCVAGLAGAQEQSGYPNFVPQDCHQFDCVNLLNNTVNLSVPIRSKAGAFPVSVSVNQSFYMMNVSGLSWTPSSANFSGFAPQANGLLQPGTGVTGSFPTITTPGVACTGSGTTTKYTGWVVETANYSVHPLSATLYTDVDGAGASCITGSGFTNQQTIDGSGFTASAAANGQIASSIYARNGTTFTTLSITDANSNSLVNASGTSLTDSMGLKIISSGFSTATGPIQWTDVNGGTPQVSFTIPSTTNVETNFGCSGIGEYGPVTFAADLPTTITLADDTTIGLAYEPTPSKTGYVTGRLQKITLPTGGTITYAYTGTHNGIDCTYATPDTMTRTLGNGDVTSYSLAYVSSGVWHDTVSNTVTDPGGNATVYTFVIAGSSYVQTAILSKLTYQGAVSSTNLVSSDYYCYNRTVAACVTAGIPPTSAYYPNAPVTSVAVFHNLGNGTSATAYAVHYVTLDAYGNVTYSADYDFGGTSPIRATTITYYQSGTSCGALANANVNDKPCEISTVQGSSTVADKKFYYDGNGNLTKTSLWNGSAWIGQTSANTYNANGTPIKTFDLANNETDYTYSSANYSDGCTGATQYPFPTKVENMGTTVARTAYYDCAGGVKLKDGDANGSLTVYGYANAAGTADPYWRVSSVTDAIGTATSYTIYPTSAAPNTSGSSFEFNSSSSIEAVTKTVDAYGRVINVQKNQSVGGSNYDTVSTAYSWTADAPYFQTTTSQPCSAAANGTCTAVHTTEYGPLGLYTETTASNEMLTTTYPQNDVLSVLSPAPTGENNKQTQTEYDGLGRVTKVCHIGTTATTGSGTTCGQNTGSASGATDAYTYTQGSGYTEVQVKRNGSQTRTTYFDALGRLYQRITPEGGTWNYYYDTGACAGGAASAGNLTCVKDPNGNVLNYFYDSLNRVTKVNANGTTCRHFYFDQTYGTVPTGVTTPTNTLGLLAEDSTDDCAGHLITDEWHSYDKDHRELDSYLSTPHSTQYYHSTATFFENGAVKTLQLASPSLYTMTYTLDGEGRTNSAKVGSNVMVYNTTFDPAAGGNCAGGVNTVSLIAASSDSDTYTCDPNTGRMKTYAFTVGASPATLTGTLTWNANGTLQKLATSDGFNAGGTMTCASNPTGSVGYDDWSRLLTIDCGGTNWGQNFSYDIYDNLTKAVISGRTGTTWNPTYSSTTNQFSGGTFDSNGNTKTDGTGANYWGWNEFSKMAWYNTSSTTPTCGTNGKCATYDAFGRLVEQSAGSVWKEYWYTQAGQVQMSGTTANFAYWPTSAVGAVLVFGNAGTNSYIHKDWLGNARVVSTHARVVTTDQAYTPYGEVFSQFGSTGSQYQNFAGITGNFNNGVQWDTPNRELAVFSRWLSPDPANFGWNRYAYATNPNSDTDPIGLCEGGQENCIGQPTPCDVLNPCGPGSFNTTQSNCVGDCGPPPSFADGPDSPYGGADPKSGASAPLDPLDGTLTGDFTDGANGIFGAVDSLGRNDPAPVPAPVPPTIKVSVWATYLFDGTFGYATSNGMPTLPLFAQNQLPPAANGASQAAKQATRGYPKTTPPPAPKPPGTQNTPNPVPPEETVPLPPWLYFLQLLDLYNISVPVVYGPTIQTPKERYCSQYPCST
jgi:hypothetical protein